MISDSALTEHVVENHEWRWVFISTAFLLLLVVVPFVWVFAVAGPDRQFMGMLVTPIDGASYLAKMYQGQQGAWLLELPYTPEQHDGVFLFTFYLALGHIGRVLRVEPLLIFHAVRLLGIILMSLAIYEFVSLWTDDVPQRRISWALAMLGAGFGWVTVAFFGYPTVDVLRLPEAFPLQAGYATAHFPLAIGAAVVVATILVRVLFIYTDLQPEVGMYAVGLAAGSLFLISTSPFSLLPIALGCGVYVLWKWVKTRSFPSRELGWGLIVGVFSLPLFLYNMWAISADNPIFQQWMMQNTTPSPPVWDYLIAFGPLLILAGVGIWGSRDRLRGDDLVLLGWLLGTFVLLYAPLGLQRRFAIGITVPLAVYAGRAVRRIILPAVAARWRPLALTGIFAAFAPTLILVVIIPMLGALEPEGEALFFMTNDEVAAARWLEDNAADDEVVLASPSMSLFLPVWGNNVVYGHPFETVNAAAREAAVEAYFMGSSCDVVTEEGVDYVVIGERERALVEEPVCLPQGEPVFSRGAVAIYEQ